MLLALAHTKCEDRQLASVSLSVSLTRCEYRYASPLILLLPQRLKPVTQLLLSRHLSQFGNSLWLIFTGDRQL
jgi:hypothetical protein